MMRWDKGGKKKKKSYKTVVLSSQGSTVKLMATILPKTRQTPCFATMRTNHSYQFQIFDLKFNTSAFFILIASVCQRN